jgi:molybdopterin-guanine dinucleotide biosynthesis protein A
VAGLDAVRHDTTIVVGGDMPWLRAEVLELMLAHLAGVVDAVALELDARAQQLPLVVRRDAGLAAADRLVRAGERRLGALAEALDGATVPEAVWRALDPTAGTLRDVDVPADLPPSGPVDGSGSGARIEDARG